VGGKLGGISKELAPMEDLEDPRHGLVQLSYFFTKLLELDLRIRADFKKVTDLAFQLELELELELPVPIHDLILNELLIRLVIILTISSLHITKYSPR
jgi:hypothetical protein